MNEKAAQKPTVLDLFSGIGGFSLAFEAEGFETIGFSEIDPYASAVLRKHWPHVINYGDVRDVPDGLHPTVITAGFPCQPFSIAGKQRGKADDRYLWPTMLDAVKKDRANWLVFENVAQLQNMELDNMLNDLEAIGYDGQPFIIPAFAVGCYHQRLRVWIVANDTCGDFQKQEMVFPLRHVQKPRKYSLRLSGSVWKPDRETYLSDMVGEFYGVSIWPHRSKTLGNAIVPQVAQEIARCIRQLI